MSPVHWMCSVMAGLPGKGFVYPRQHPSGGRVLLPLLAALLSPPAVADPPRVLVPDTDDVTRGARRRIYRTLGPDAVIVPLSDAYQQGRTQMNRRVADQQVAVRGPLLEDVQARARKASEIPYGWTAMVEEDYLRLANELVADEARIFFVDRPELREPRFALYTQTGRMAANTNLATAPWVRSIGETEVMWHHFLAGRMAAQEPTLLRTLTSPEDHGAVDYYRQLAQDGPFEPATVVLTPLPADARLLVDGLETPIPDDRQLTWSPGPLDLQVLVPTGFSQSHRFDLQPGQTLHPNQTGEARMQALLPLVEATPCTPELDGELNRYLVIYDALHADSATWLATHNARHLHAWNPTTSRLESTNPRCP